MTAFDYASYWETRYASGGNSGWGSYGDSARHKADVLNAFVSERNVQSVIDFGCGDGAQLTLAEYPRYLGLDVSPTAVRMCADKFDGDPTKSFMQYHPAALFNRGFLRADLAICLDVLYHITDDDDFEKTLTDVLAAASKYAILYTTDAPKEYRGESPHGKHRNVRARLSRLTDWSVRYQHVSQTEHFELVWAFLQRR